MVTNLRPRISKREQKQRDQLLADLRKHCPLFHVIHYIEEGKADEIMGHGILPPGVLPARMVAAFGFIAVQFILDELAACGDATAASWAADFKRSKEYHIQQRLAPKKKGRKR